MTGDLHFQVHPCGVAELLIDPLPEGAKRDGALYPDGARLTDLKEVRELLYKMQRPAIAPNVSIVSDGGPYVIADPVHAPVLAGISSRLVSSFSLTVDDDLC